MIALVWRSLTVQILTNLLDRSPDLVEMLSRKPLPHEKFRPHRHFKTRKIIKGNIFSDLFGLLTLAFMIGVFQFMSHGQTFLKSDVLVPELLWGAGLSLLYWLEDIVTRQVIINPKMDASDNLNYNSGGYKFLLATIFISQVIILATMFVMIFLSESGFINKLEHGYVPVEWILISVLALLKFAYEIRLPKKPRRLPR